MYHGCDLNQTLLVGEAYRASALLVAACQSPQRVRPDVFVQALLDTKADPKTKDCYGADLRHFQLLEAFQEGIGPVRSFLQRHCRDTHNPLNLNALIFNPNVHVREGKDYARPLVIAIHQLFFQPSKRQYASSLQQLLVEFKANPQVRDSVGCSLLDYVPSAGYEQFVDALENGADPLLPRLYQGSPLTPIEMVWNWFRDLLKRQDYHNSRATHLLCALLEKKAKPGAIAAAAWSGRGRLPKLHELWRILTLPCVDVNWVRGGEVPLLTACRAITNRVDLERVVALLITAKANLYAQLQVESSGISHRPFVTVYGELVRVAGCFCR